MIKNESQRDGVDPSESSSVVERLIRMEQALNNLRDRVSTDIAEIKESVKEIVLKLNDVEKKLITVEHTADQQYMKKDEMPCNVHKEDLARQDARLQKLHEDMVVLNTKWATEFRPIQKVAYLILVLLITSIITAVLSLVSAHSGSANHRPDVYAPPSQYKWTAQTNTSARP